MLTRLAQIYTLVNEPERALDTLEPLLGIPELDQPGGAAERPDLGAAARASAVRAAGGVRLTVRRLAFLHWLMRPETRRNRNPLSIDHAFT